MSTELDSPAAALTSWRHRRVGIYLPMAFSALLSLIASFVLSVDAVVLAAAPDTQLVCDVNAVLSCGTVAQSWQATLFGFPNAFLGLMTEPVVLTIAVASLAGVRFPRWFMIAAQIGYALGLALAWWLFAQSLTQIGAVCPWCLLITVSTTVVFVSLLRANLIDDVFGLGPVARQRVIGALRIGVDVVVTLVAVALIALLVLLVHGRALFAGW